jgi:hypothetical protein
MDDQELQEHLAALKETWRVPPEPPMAEMWQVIERRSFALPHANRSWIRTVLPLAATLILGFGLGQIVPNLAPSRQAAAPPQETAQHTTEQAAFVGVATNYLERVTALLVNLTDETRNGKPLEGTNEQARDLLATTRLLLDSPNISDSHLRDLLDDLELVLAQIVWLPRRGAASDVYLIDQALDQREVLPRLRVMLAENLTSEP